jgi:hypothetical protein
VGAPLRVGACLSLSGRYARFGVQAAAGLETWSALDGGAVLVVEDDGSDPARLEAAIGGLAARCDLLLGPYSTRLMRSAARALGDRDCLVWNQGGSGDDVMLAAPGRVVSVLTPAGRYAEPFLRRVAAEPARVPLWIAAGPGSFGRQVAAGAESHARSLGLQVLAGDEPVAPAAWDLLSAGTFEDDVALVGRALAGPRPPRRVCSVAAGVRDFAGVAAATDGIYGVAQWFPGTGRGAELGPGEAAFLAAYAGRTGRAPDYPAVQAAAAALDTITLFGRFRIDPASGRQVAHETVLVRWAAGGAVRPV